MGLIWDLEGRISGMGTDWIEEEDGKQQREVPCSSL